MTDMMFAIGEVQAMRKRCEGSVTYCIHGEVVPDAILPALMVWIFRFIGVHFEPSIDALQGELVPIGTLQSPVDKNGVWKISSALFGISVVHA